MMMRHLTLTIAAVSMALAGSLAHAGTILYDNIGPITSAYSGGAPIGLGVAADDFTLTSAVNVAGFTFWVGGSSFVNSSIGWAVFNDNAGAVGSLIDSGNSIVTTTDTGIGTRGGNVLKAEGAFGSGISLGAGTYWVSFRDGTWGAAYDNSGGAYWMSGSGLTVGNTSRLDTNVLNPTFSFNNGSAGNLYFQLNGAGSGAGNSASVPEPGSVALLLSCGLGLLIARRRRRSTPVAE